MDDTYALLRPCSPKDLGGYVPRVSKRRQKTRQEEANLSAMERRNAACFPDREIDQWLVVRSSTIKGAGLGLFTRCLLYRGEIISRYSGKYLTDAEYRAKYPNPVAAEYVIHLNPNLCLDGDCEESVTFAKYSNHQPRIANAAYKKEGNRIFVIATKRIQPGEEVFVDYGKYYWNERFGFEPTLLLSKPPPIQLEYIYIRESERERYFRRMASTVSSKADTSCGKDGVNEVFDGSGDGKEDEGDDDDDDDNDNDDGEQKLEGLEELEETKHTKLSSVDGIRDNDVMQMGEDIEMGGCGSVSPTRESVEETAGGDDDALTDANIVHGVCTDECDRCSCEKGANVNVNMRARNEEESVCKEMMDGCNGCDGMEGGMKSSRSSRSSDVAVMDDIEPLHDRLSKRRRKMDIFFLTR